MKDWKSMSTDELWDLHQSVTDILRDKMLVKKAGIEIKLRSIASLGPKVLPKYRNPENPAETWSGRGKQPRWLSAQLRSGKELDNLLTDRSLFQKRGRTGGL